MLHSGDIVFRRATSADVPAMVRCRLNDAATGPADPRMAAYLDGEHQPQQALPPRAGYVALRGEQVVAYIAGHRTNRHGCQGELQYLYVAPGDRRRGLGTGLLRLLAEWFREQGVQKVCVGIANDSPTQRSRLSSITAPRRSRSIGTLGRRSELLEVTTSAARAWGLARDSSGRVRFPNRSGR